MTPQQVDELIKNYPKLSEAKFKRRVARLERIRDFYKSKAPESKDGGYMFNTFVSALNYAIEIMKKYRQLTIKLHKLAREQQDETGTGSESR